VTAVTVPGTTWTLRRIDRRWLIVATLVVWWLIWRFMYGTHNLPNGGPTFIQDWFLRVRNAADASRDSNPIFIYFFNPIAKAVGSAITSLTTVATNLGWTGVTGLAAAIALVVADWRHALLTAAGFIGFGILGLQVESMQTLVQVIVAVVVSLLIGIPLGIWAGVSDRFNRLVTPVLDVMQILPTFAYLPLITLFFLIGPASGTIVTMIYAIPPAIRLTATGIREVSVTTVEASESLGATRLQRLRDVQLPMAKRTIVLGINQTMMAALSMITIAALIAAPGLGSSVISALIKLDVGAAFNAGLAIVFMAIVFDRVTTAASLRAEAASRTGHLVSRRVRVIVYGSAVGLIVLGVVLPGVNRTLATFPSAWIHSTRNPINSVSNWTQFHWYGATSWLTNTVTMWVIDPLQSLLTNSPWLVVMAAIGAVALLISRRRAAAIAVLCLAGTILMGLWQDAMVTLAAVLIGALLTMVVGVIFGVWLGRSVWADRLLRPVLDAAQVMPPFVYLVPCLALFGASRFTGIVAALVYAAPAVIKIAAEGIRGVPENTTEAAISSGSNSWQTIVKVQLPMARNMLMVALNQGIIFVLAMVVVSGLVGGQGLGLQVVNGFSQSTLAGVGLAAGLAIVFLGIMLDRITQSAGLARRSSDEE
jgi:glycine betaine/proline transport system permease protein